MADNSTIQQQRIAKISIAILVIAGLALTTFNTSFTVKYSVNTKV